jgi:hypothetical protein
VIIQPEGLVEDALAAANVVLFYAPERIYAGKTIQVSRLALRG